VATAAGDHTLPRTLRLRDLVLLKVAAIVNLSFIAPVAVYGRVTMAMWALAFLTFFVTGAAGVLTYAKRYPGEGGMYLWARKQFGEVHGFFSGWCYWINNLFYIPMQLVYVAGVLAYAGGAKWAGLVNEKWYVSTVAFGWLAVATGTNIRGLGVGKWVQNLGAVAALVTSALIVLAGTSAWLQGTAANPPFATGLGWETLSAFSVMCFAFVGFELASTMGDEMENPQRDLPRAVYVAGTIILTSYIVVTGAMLLLVPVHELGAIQGVMQAVEQGAARARADWVVFPIALALAFSIGGGASAWFSGSARVPFVAGIGNAMPAALGRVHPRWGSPYVALLTSGIVSAILIALTLIGSSVMEAYQVLLKASVVIQLVPFVYMFAGLMILDDVSMLKRVAGFVGLLTTVLGIVAAFIPTSDVDNALVFETKMLLGCLIPTAIGFILFARAQRAARS
jgi:amino acid transporter